MNDLLPSDAVEVRRPAGWCQRVYGRYFVPDGEVCMVGALARVMAVSPGEVEQWPELRFIERALEFKERYFLVTWKDQPGRTAAEVATALERAAELARAEGF